MRLDRSALLLTVYRKRRPFMGTVKRSPRFVCNKEENTEHCYARHEKKRQRFQVSVGHSD